MITYSEEQITACRLASWSQSKGAQDPTGSYQQGTAPLLCQMKPASLVRPATAAGRYIAKLQAPEASQAYIVTTSWSPTVMVPSMSNTMHLVPCSQAIRLHHQVCITAAAGNQPAALHSSTEQHQQQLGITECKGSASLRGCAYAGRCHIITGAIPTALHRQKRGMLVTRGTTERLAGSRMYMEPLA